MNHLADSDNAQKTLGLWSQVMAAIQTFFFLITLGLVPRNAPWEVYIIMANGILAFFILGVALAVLGLTRQGSHSSICFGGAIWGTAVVGIALLVLAANAAILF